MDWLVAIFAVLMMVVGINVMARWRQGNRRTIAATPPLGEEVLRQARQVPARLLVNRSLPTGARKGLVNLTKADLVLTTDRLIVATHHGRVLELNARNPVSLKCVGPRRLVAEGLHPDGQTEVRVELLVDEPEGWARGCGALATSSRENGPASTGSASGPGSV